MSITATELKINFGKYLMLAETEDIYITRNGKVVAKLSNPYQDRVDVAKSLFGVLSNDMTLEAAQKLFIYSANKQKDYMKSSVKVYEPSALLKLLEEENQTE